MKTILFIVIFIIASYGCAMNTFAAERTVTITGRVDVSGLDKASGSFTVRALQPQKRNVELARSTTDGAGNFQLSIDGEALALYGVVLEASSTGNRALVLEAAVLRARDA